MKWDADVRSSASISVLFPIPKKISLEDLKGIASPLDLSEIHEAAEMAASRLERTIRNDFLNIVTGIIGLARESNWPDVYTAERIVSELIEHVRTHTIVDQQ